MIHPYRPNAALGGRAVAQPPRYAGSDTFGGCVTLTALGFIAAAFVAVPVARFIWSTLTAYAALLSAANGIN